MMPCQEYPVEMRQVFSSYSDSSHLYCLWEEGRKFELNISWDNRNPSPEMIYEKEFLSLYMHKTLQRA